MPNKAYMHNEDFSLLGVVGFHSAVATISSLLSCLIIPGSFGRFDSEGD